MKRISHLIGIVLLLLGIGSAQTVRLDDSDWWSLLRTDDERRPQPSRVLTPRSHFEILGISLFDDDLFQAVTKRLGKATQVERGDAATGRDQLCYVSLDGAVHVVFELGEVESTFYLFRGGESWKGSELCRKSSLVADTLITRGGLRLGMTVSEVKKIFGTPSAEKNGKLTYVREMKQKTPLRLLEEIRKNAPQHYSDEEFHRQFDFYDENVYIEARFMDSRLMYVAISQSGTT